MAKEILKIRIDNGLGDNNPTFKDIELDEYSAKFPRMGFPELSATLMWPTPLDDEWTHKEYVVLRGEKFYVTDTPDAEKTNNTVPYKHSIGFTSEFARILGNTFFEDAVPSYSETYDKPCSNSSKFTFYGTISELCDRLNCSFIKAGIADSILKTKTSLTTLDTPIGDGYCVMLDPYGEGNVYDPNKTYNFEWEDKSHWEAITEGFNITEIPFERRGKCVVFGAVPKVIDHKFEYGHNNELLSVKHKNAKAKVINRITMQGDSENIPHYYPNETEYGHISIATKTGNSVLTTDMLEIANITQLLSRINADKYAVLGKYGEEQTHTPDIKIDSYNLAAKEGAFANYTPKTDVYYCKEQGAVYWRVRVNFELSEQTTVYLNQVFAKIWRANNTPSKEYHNCISAVSPLFLEKMTDSKYEHRAEILTKKIEKKDDGTLYLGTLEKGYYSFGFKIFIDDPGSYQFVAYLNLEKVILNAETKYAKTGYYWEVGDKKYDGVGALGVKLNADVTDAMIGDGFGWVASGRMPFQDHLVPPKYRNTLGAERFYNALNAPYSEEYASEHPDAYLDPDNIDPETHLPKPYIFPNPFIEGAPSEHIYKNEDIKPTIEGVTNDVIKGYDDDGNPIYQLLGEIADIAYDADDNDALKAESTEDNDKNDSLKYEHSFFYIKLNIFNGDYGFDLFAHYSQTDPMTIQMRDGSCNGCKFKIQAAKLTDETGLETYKNPIVVKDGKAVGVVSEDGIKESDLDPTQQNTQTHSIWICVQKDAETFGVIMPNQSNDFKPKIGDKFNIINIDLPQAYILAAEKRLEEDGMRYMLDNNEEKFSFDIQASRIFFAENPGVLAQLDEYSTIKVKYNGREYKQYVNQLSIDCKSNEPLPNIGIDLTDTLAVGQSFIEQVAERASSLIANPYTMGGALGGGSGMSFALAELRYLNKMRDDRTPYKIATDTAFEVGNFVSGGSGGIFFRDPETGQTYIEADKLKVRMKAIFEELEIAKVSTIGGKFVITPGGGLTISFVEELANSYRCYFKAKEEDKGAECRLVVGDQVQCHEFNIQAGTHHNASNRYYWRLVTAVNNAESYIELSKSDCDNTYDIPSDAPMAGDTIVQLGNRNNTDRQSAIILSTVDAFAPCITLYNGINTYSLDGKAVVTYGYDKSTKGVFFRLGSANDSHYLEYTQNKGLEVAGKISVKSTYDDKSLGDYIDDTAQSAADVAKNELQGKIDELQNQIDGVVETWNGTADPTKSNYPANEWTTNMDKQAHIGDVYFNIGAYDASSNPNAGHAWRWYYNSPTDYGWIEIADSDATRALQLAQMSVLDTDVLYKQIDSRTDAPATPTVNTSGIITDFKGWTTDAPEWKANKYIWQTTYVKKGDGSAKFSKPTCISGRNGTNITISSQSVKYSTNHGASQPPDATFTLNDVPTNLKAGDYLWSMTEVMYSNGHGTKSYAVSRIGTSVTITSTSVTYAKSTDTTQPADSSFTYTTIGAVGLGAGDYLWTKTEVEYSDENSTKSYTVSRIGSDGEDGLPGAPGDDGRTPYVHYAYANSANGQTEFSTTYFKDALYVGVCTDYNQADPTTYSSYEWSRLRGEDGTPAKIVVVNADATAFVYSDNFATLVTPTSIGLSATLQGTTGYQWSYKKEGATAFTNVSGGTSATLSVSPTNTTYFPSGARACVFRCTSGDVYDEVTIVKVSSGSNGNDAYTVLLTNESHIFEGDTEKAVVASAESSVIAYKGATQVAATIGTITRIPVGMTVAIGNNGTTSAKFTLNVTNALTTKQGTLNIPVTVDGKTFTQVFSWSLSLKGKDGRGIVSIVEEYAINNSATTTPADSDFSTAVPTMTDTNRYLWNREITTYTNNTSETTQAIMIGVKGQNGVDGATVVSVTNWYLASNKASGVKTTDTGWVTDASHTNATTDATKPYLWNYEVTKWSKGADTSTAPHVVGKFGKDGKTPRITEQYFLSTSTTQLLPATNKWEDEKPTWVAGCYYWTRSKIDYGDGDVEYTEGICATGEKGESAYILDLTDEVKGIACDASGKPLSTSIPTSQAQVWKGSKKVAHSDAAYSIAQATGVTASVNNSTGVVSLSNLTADNATVVVQAVADGVTLQSTISVYKVKPGGNYQPNLLIETKEAHTATASASQTHAYTGFTFDEPLAVKAGDKFTVSVENIEVLSGNPASFTALFYNDEYHGGDGYYSYEATLTKDKKYVTLTIRKDGTARGFLLYAGVAGSCNGNSVRYTKVMLVKGDTPMEWAPAASEMLGTLGYSVVASVSRPNFTESQWAAVGTTGHVDNWSNTESIRNGCRIGDYFRVYGTATDSGKSHVAVYKSDTASGTLHGECVAHEVADAGEAAVVYQLEPSVDNITKSMTGKLSVNSVTCSVYKTTGNSQRVLTSDKQVSYQVIKTDGTSITGTKTPTNGVTSAVAVTPDTEAVIWELKGGNNVLLDRERVPVLSDASDLEASSRNLLIGSEEIIVDNQFTTNNYAFNTFELPIPLKKGDCLALMVEGITNIVGSSTEFTAACYNESISTNIGGGDKHLTSSNRTAIFEITADEAKPKFLFYAGKKTATANKSVKYTKAILVKGNVPMQTWVAAPEDMEVGGVNLLRCSGDGVTASGFLSKKYNLTQTPAVGKTYTVTIWGSLADTKINFVIYNSSGVIKLADLKKVGEGKYQATFKWVNTQGTYVAPDKCIMVHGLVEGTSDSLTIERIKMEAGNVGTDWSPAPEDAGTGVNLLRNSRARFTRTYSSEGDHYNLLKRLTVYLENGKTYTISGRTNCTSFSNSHLGGDYSNRCVLWLCSTANSPQGTVNTIVSGTDMATDGSRGHTFVWENPTGEYFLRVNFYAPGTWWVEKVKIEKGSYATEWTPSPEDVEYLEDALKEDTTIMGGLILASTVSLGQNNTDYTTQTTWSGINGIYKGSARGGGIAAWYGGDMYDLADYYDWSESEGKWVAKGGVSAPSRIAKGVDRMDGSGYRAGGSLWWDNAGNLYADGTFTGHITVGAPNGQRIELDPTQKVMKIYDSSGTLVATHSGRTLAVQDAQPNNTGNVNGTKNFSVSFPKLTVSSGTEAVETVEQTICSGNAGDTGTLTLTVPSFKLDASAQKAPSLTSVQPSATIELHLVVTVGTTTTKYLIGRADSFGEASSMTSSANKYQIPVPKGSGFTAKIIAECSVKGAQGNYGTLSAASRTISYVLVTQAYRCEYGANGWVISKDSNNYAYLIVENGKLNFKVVSGGTPVISS